MKNEKQSPAVFDTKSKIKLILDMKKLFLYLSVFIIAITCMIILIGGGFGDRNDYSRLNQGKPLIFAHRGNANACVENSIESFLKSDSVGFKAIETDIISTKDGKLIIFHDENCNRLLGIDTSVNQVNWEDINTKHLIYKNNQTKNIILSLDMFLEQIEPSKILYLDIKKGNKSIADSLLFILKKHKKYQNIIIADSNLLFLIYLKMKDSSIRVCLEGFNKGKEWLYFIIPKKYKPDYYSSFLFQVDQKHIEFLRKHSLINNRIVYGVDSNNIKSVFELGIKNIILDYDDSMGTIEALELKLIK